jgi:hypothetical protein
MNPICFVESPKPPTNLKGRKAGTFLASGVLKNTGSSWSKVIVWLLWNQLHDQKYCWSTELTKQEFRSR